MRKWLLSLCWILSLTGQALAQEVSPLIVKTFRTTEPTTVKTAEPFTQKYQIRFIDLSHLGQEITVNENLLNTGWLGSFEVINLEIEKNVKQGEFIEYVWDCTYTLRIINPQKGALKIPAFAIPWVRRKIGQASGDAPLKTAEIKTEEVYLNYVTTVTADPALDIRDTLDFGSYSSKSFAFWISSWIVGLFTVSFGLIMLVKSFKSEEVVQEEQEYDKQDAVLPPDGIGGALNRRKIRRALLRSIQKIRSPSHNDPNLLGNVLHDLKAFIRSEVAGLKFGDTPADILRYMQNMPGSSKKSTLLELAKAMAEYQDDIDRGRAWAFENQALQADRLDALLIRLRWYYHTREWFAGMVEKAKRSLRKRLKP